MRQLTSDRLPEVSIPVCVIIAGGPSLTKDDVCLVDSLSAAGSVWLIGINDAYRISKNLGMIYAADAPWWAHHRECVERYILRQLAAGFLPAQLWTCGDEAANKFPEVQYIESDPSAEFFIKSKDRIGRGVHGGFQALNIALNMGFKKIILLGYDCKADNPNNRHWFGNHPQTIAKNSPYQTWVDIFEKAARTLYQWENVDVVNCSRDTAINAFRIGDLKKEISLDVAC